MAGDGIIWCAFFIIITLLVQKTIYKKKIMSWMAVSAVLVLCGWVLMIFSPGTLLNKVAEVNFDVYANNFDKVATKYREEQQFLLLIFLILFLGAIFFQYEKKYSLCSIVCFLSSLMTNFLHIGAIYYESRSMLASTIFLLLAICFLLREYMSGYFQSMILRIGVVFGLSVCSQFIVGAKDIIQTYEDCMQREVTISEEIQSGKSNLELPVITSETKYSSKYGLKDLDISDCTSYPNYCMAKYYGVDSILGISDKDME